MSSTLVLYEGCAYWCNPPFDDEYPTSNTWTILPDNELVVVPTGRYRRAIKHRAMQALGMKTTVTEESSTVTTNGPFDCYHPISLDCCTTASVPYTSIGSKPAWGILKNKEEDNMRNELVITANATTSAPDQSKRDFLSVELYQAFSKKEDDLLTTYGLRNDDGPTSPKDFIKRIQDGKFVLNKRGESFGDDDEGDDYFDSYCVTRYITWRDPAVKADKAGFKTAKALMTAAQNDVTRTIAIGTPEEGLAALKAFEAQTFSVN